MNGQTTTTTHTNTTTTTLRVMTMTTGMRNRGLEVQMCLESLVCFLYIYFFSTNYYYNQTTCTGTTMTNGHHWPWQQPTTTNDNNQQQPRPPRHITTSPAPPLLTMTDCHHQYQHHTTYRRTWENGTQQMGLEMQMCLKLQVCFFILLLLCFTNCYLLQVWNVRWQQGHHLHQHQHPGWWKTNRAQDTFASWALGPRDRYLLGLLNTPPPVRNPCHQPPFNTIPPLLCKFCERRGCIIIFLLL